MASEHWSKGAVLVTGGTGKTGRRLVERLKHAGRTVRVGSRNAAIPFDWERPDSWARALEGMSAVYVSFQPDLAVPRGVDAVRAFLQRARSDGIEKIVLISGRGEPEAEEAEQALRDIGADWTILRASWFAQNFSESFFLDSIVAGDVMLPEGLAAEPFVDAEDIADIAAAAFSDSRHSRQLYELTGPEPVTFEDAVAAIARAAGRTIDYLSVSREEYRAELMRHQVPDAYVDLLMYLFTTVLDGRNAPLCDGVLRALGRAPRPFSAYVERTAASGVWGGRHA